MTKTRNEYIYQFTGTILGRAWQKASPESKYAGAKYFTLKVVLENQPFKSLQVFKDKLIKTTLWDLLHTKPQQVLRKKYIFHCRNQRGYYYLVDWEEVN